MHRIKQLIFLFTLCKPALPLLTRSTSTLVIETVSIIEYVSRNSIYFILVQIQLLAFSYRRSDISTRLYSSIENRLKNLKFGFERIGDDIAAVQEQRHMISRVQRRISKVPNNKSDGGVAVCNNQRPQGCAPLLGAVSPQLSLQPLPCVTEGICPYFRFRCSKGHEWKAVPGSAVIILIMYCEYLVIYFLPP